MQRMRQSGRLIFIAVLMCVGVPCVPQQALPPSAKKSLEWDVVSVRENKDSDAQSTVDFGATTGELRIRALALQYLIQTGLNYLRPNYVFGVPDWGRAARYDIEAKVAATDIEAYKALSALQRFDMLRTILVERFALKIHVEPREFPIYELRVAKGGVKMKEATSGNVYADGLKDDGTPAGTDQIRWTGWGDLKGQGVTTERIATVLSGSPRAGLGRALVDRTGLTAKYDFALRFAPEQPPYLNGSPAPQLVDANAPGIFTAIEEQLGLKLVSTKGPIECLVIDHVERPPEN